VQQQALLILSHWVLLLTSSVVAHCTAFKKYSTSDPNMFFSQHALANCKVSALPARLPCTQQLHVLQATDAAAAAYCPSRKELCEAAGISDAELLLLEPQTTTTRPAYAVWLDAANKRLVWGFRGTTDLNVSALVNITDSHRRMMLTSFCKACVESRQ
jgi:hypothetical protein